MIISHVVLCTPFAMAINRLKLSLMAPNLEAAAWNLGADEWRTMRLVIVPFCMPAILASIFITAAISLDEFAIAWFVSGLEETLPVRVLNLISRQSSPSVNAIGSFTFTLSLALVVLAQVGPHLQPAPQRGGSGPMSEQPFLRFTGIEKRFGGTLAVTGFDLDIARGDFIAIMGPSGCGKTTTLRMLAGLEKPTAGQILRDGEAIDDTPPWLRRMPLVWQNYALFPFLSVLDNVAFGLRNEDVAKAERHRRAMGWLERLGISDLAQRQPETLSGGQAQRVALARALVLEPEVLLLDEPLSALDAHMVVRMQTEIAELQRALGITFVYVTHNQSEAFAMADRVVIMNAGRIQQVGSSMDVYRAPKTRFVAEFVGTNNIVDGTIASASRSILSVETGLGRLVSTNPTGAEVVKGSPVHLVVSADLVSVNAKSVAEDQQQGRRETGGRKLRRQRRHPGARGGWGTGTQGPASTARTPGPQPRGQRRSQARLRPLRHLDHPGSVGGRTQTEERP